MPNYKFSNENMSSGNGTIPSGLQGTKHLDDDIFNSVGIYSKSDIKDARFNKYSRFGRILDPYGRLNDTREVLFFVKPDLHISTVDYVSEDGNYVINSVYDIGGYDNSGSYRYNGLTLNPQLDNNAYFRDLIMRHPEVVRELQYSAATNVNSDPFSHLLSFSVSSNLDLPGSESSTLETGSTVFGTHLEYLKDSEASDENPSFSLEFVDTKDLDVYHFFKAYSEYQTARKGGLVTPPTMDYYRYKRTHNTMGIYKFLLAEDMETIIYYAYFWGVFPTSTPREAFAEPTFPEGLTFSVSFKSAFMEDMNPIILDQFNNLMEPLIPDINNWLPVVYQNYSVDNVNHSYVKDLDGMVGKYTTIRGNDGKTNAVFENSPTSRINGTLPRAAYVDTRRLHGESKFKYRLHWYA